MKRVKEKNAMFTMKGSNFHYGGVECEYDTIYHCEDYNCGTDDYCRCSTIENGRVTKVDLEQIAARFGVKGLDLYAVERILHFNKVWLPDNWNVESEGGYYGEELKGVFLDDTVAKTVDSQVSTILFLKDDAYKIEELLRMEYGYLLEVIPGRTWAVEEILKSELIFGHEDHYQKLDKGVVLTYADCSLPRGVVIPHYSKFKLLDGYHRCSAGGEKLKVYVGRKNESKK